MSYSDMSLSELMASIRKNTPTGKGDDDDLLDLDDLFADDVPPARKPEPIDIQQRIDQAMEDLKLYRLDSIGQQVIREFITFQLRVRQDPCTEADSTFYNLMLLCEEPDTALGATAVLRELLDIPKGKFHSFSEAQGIRRMGMPGTQSAIPKDAKMVLIYDCMDAPRMNVDGNASARDRSLQQVERYQGFWRYVCNFILSNPETILIVSSTRSVYRGSLRLNNDLARRVCAHHVHLQEIAAEEVLQQCLQEFRNSSFTLAPDFEKALSKYFLATYRGSDLRGNAFSKDLIRRIFARYYCQKRDERILTPDCVPDDDPKLQTAEEVLGQMSELIGLQSAKEEFSNIYKMRLAGLSEGTGRYHMLFLGNPGTGKTTVAQMAAELLYSMHVIKKNKVIIAKPSDMISEWIGGTGTKAMEVIRRAYNGVLFIDEAYGIANMDRGEELLNILVQEMENNSDKLVVIMAGYTDEMRDLMKANPGLASRIGRQIMFDDYNPEELVQIFLMMARKEGFTLHADARDELDDCIASLMTKEFFGNARDIRNMLQELKEAWSEDYYKLAQQYGEENVQLEKVFMDRHFAAIMPPRKEISINDLIGLDVMKDKLESFKRQALYQKHLKEKGFKGLADFSMHMIFTGNPGTGKTTVAKLIADDLYSIGVLRTNRLVVAERKDLISAYGDTGKKCADVIRRAIGGVLFIDEAYSLADSRGAEAIETFLTAMEEHKSDTVFIFAGYVQQMQQFLATNPGIQSRIGYTFHFEDYAPDELTKMYAKKMAKTGFQVSGGALKKVRQIMEYFHKLRNFGNGRFVDHVIHQTISQRAMRDFTGEYRNIITKDIPTIKTLIDTAPNGMYLYDPTKIAPEHHRRTAIHELGHAIVMVKADPENLPKRISIRSQAGSYGRVTLNNASGNQTEQQLMDELAVALGGKNAERAFYGTHSTGCAGDYAYAKDLAKDMIERFAMTTFGETPKRILREAENRSILLIEENKALIEKMADILLAREELSGEEFVKILEQEEGKLANV